jgi:hypothetical protein
MQRRNSRCHAWREFAYFRGICWACCHVPRPKQGITTAINVTVLHPLPGKPRDRAHCLSSGLDSGSHTLHCSNPEQQSHLQIVGFHHHQSLLFNKTPKSNGLEPTDQNTNNSPATRTAGTWTLATRGDLNATMHTLSSGRRVKTDVVLRHTRRPCDRPCLAMATW